MRIRASRAGEKLAGKALRQQRAPIWPKDRRNS